MITPIHVYTLQVSPQRLSRRQLLNQRSFWQMRRVRPLLGRWRLHPTMRRVMKYYRTSATRTPHRFKVTNAWLLKDRIRVHVSSWPMQTAHKKENGGSKWQYRPIYRPTRRGFRGGGAPGGPPPPVQSHNDKGGGGGLFPVDLSVQTANTWFCLRRPPPVAPPPPRS